jgi:deferrochelatase/peroxidase EfeB
LVGGLFFIAFVKNPGQFIIWPTRLGADDALNGYIQHRRSGAFACPPGLQPGQHWADDIFT